MGAAQLRPRDIAGAGSLEAHTGRSKWAVLRWRLCGDSVLQASAWQAGTAQRGRWAGAG